MKLNRFYCEKIALGPIQLESTESHHLTHVMRQKTGDDVEVFDGKGAIGTGTVSEISRKNVSLHVKSIQNYENNHPKVIIAASIAKGQRFDWMISKCTELGVDHIATVLFERTVKRAKGEASASRLKKLIITAAKQSRRIFLPELSRADSLNNALTDLKSQYPGVRLIFGHFGETAVPLFKMTALDVDVIAFVGPEGGFTESEIQILKEAGGIEAVLTKTVLRIETAAIAFASTMCMARDTF